MRSKNYYPKMFRTRHWKSLWESNIDSLAMLRDRAQSCALVALDAEGCHADKSNRNSSITEIGIAVLPPRYYEQALADSIVLFEQSLQSFINQNSVQSHSLRVLGRERSEKNRYTYNLGPIRQVAAEEVELELTELFASIQKQYGEIILVGYDLAFEMINLISPNSHGIMQYITSWVDIQELVNDISNVKQPSLKDTLFTLHVGRAIENPPDASGYRSRNVPKGRRNHSAGLDAVCQLALLERLLILPDDDLLQIKRKIDRRREDPPKDPHDRRRPHEDLYPFIAHVKLAEARLSDRVRNYIRLQKIFASYEPTSASIAKNGKIGWVCLPSAEVLARFVSEVDGQTVAGLLWRAQWRP